MDSRLAALSGGAFAGLVIGAGQALISRRRLDPRRWIPATAVGMSLVLLLGAAAVGYLTSLASLALMGAVTGIVLGAAQNPGPARYGPAPLGLGGGDARPVALGWTVTTLGGTDVDQQVTVFAYGAAAFSALSGMLLHHRAQGSGMNTAAPHVIFGTGDRPGRLRITATIMVPNGSPVRIGPEAQVLRQVVDKEE